MTVSRPYFLLLLLALPALAWLGWPRRRYGRGRAWAALVVRCLIVVLIALSLAGIRTLHGGDELAVVFAVDLSDSIPEAEQERAWAFVREALATMGPNDRAAVVVFGAEALVERPMSAVPDLGEVMSVPRTDQTDVEKAVRLATALFPPGFARRLVLLTDGQATVGNAEAAIRQAQAQGVQVCILPLGAPPSAEVLLAELDLPMRALPGDRFDLEVVVQSTIETEARLTVLSGDRVVAQEMVWLHSGDNRFALPMRAPDPGFIPYTVVVEPAADTHVQNNRLSGYMRVEGPERVLVVADTEAEASPLVAALQATGLPVELMPPAALPTDPPALAEYGAIVLMNVPARALSSRTMAALQSYVRDLGGGLVAVGGPESYGLGGWFGTPLEETLPVEMRVRDPGRFPPMSLIVVIDKSGSMSATEGGVQKIRLAGEAAARVAELINDADEITVVAFDDRPADIIGPVPGSEREVVIDQAIRLQAGGGGIYVRESLQTALDLLKGSDRLVRHIVLLADGSDAEHQAGVRELIEEEVVPGGITLSTVAFGAGPDVAFLEEIARLGGGRFYFTEHATDLPTIFAEETQTAMRSYLVEERFYPRQVSSHPALEGVEAVPSLLGYVATSPKAAAQVVLTTHQDDPLLAVWQYGLGRAVAWTSDATGRWAAPWVGWEGFSRFWSQVVRWVLASPGDLPVEIRVEREGEGARLVVDALDGDGGFINGMEAAVQVLGPDGAARSAALMQTGPGRYEGAFVPWGRGAYLLRLTGSTADGSVVSQTVGWVSGYSEEYAISGGGAEGLVASVEQGGGRLLVEPAESFAHDLRGEGVASDLWPSLLAAAVLLWPVDVALRRLALGRRDVERALEWVRGRFARQRPVVEAPSPVTPLLRAKERTAARAARARGREAGPAPPYAGEGEASAPSRPAPRPAPPAENRREVPPADEAETLAARLLRRRRR